MQSKPSCRAFRSQLHQGRKAQGRISASVIRRLSFVAAGYACRPVWVRAATRLTRLSFFFLPTMAFRPSSSQPILDFHIADAPEFLRVGRDDGRP